MGVLTYEKRGHPCLEACKSNGCPDLFWCPDLFSAKAMGVLTYFAVLLLFAKPDSAWGGGNKLRNINPRWLDFFQTFVQFCCWVAPWILVRTKLGVGQTKPLQMWVQTKPLQMWVQTKPLQIWVQTKPLQMWVQTKPLQMWVQTKPLQMWVQTKPAGTFWFFHQPSFHYSLAEINLS